MRRTILVSAVAFLLTATPAFASNEIEKAAHALQRDAVYVAPDADPSLTASEAANLRGMIRDKKPRIFIAVLPERALSEVNEVDSLPQALHEAARLDAGYGVIAGRNFRAASSGDIGLGPGEAGDLATGAFESNHPGNNGGSVYPMLADWIGRMQAAINKPPVPLDGDAPPGGTDAYRDAAPDPNMFVPHNDGGGSGFPGGVIFVVAVLGLGLFGALARASGLGGSGFGPGTGLWSSSLLHRRRSRWEETGEDPIFFPSSGGGFDSPSDSGGGSWGSSHNSGSSGGGGSDSGSSSGGGSW